MSKNLIDLGTSEYDAEETVEMVDVFKLDGKTYGIPKKVSAGVSLAYLQKQAEEGPDAAMYYIMHKLLGKDAYVALMNHEKLEKSDLNRIMETVEKHALSDEEGK